MVHAAYLSTAHGRTIAHSKRNALVPPARHAAQVATEDQLTLSSNMADIQCRACRIGIGLPVRPLTSSGNTTATIVAAVGRRARTVVSARDVVVLK